MFDLCFFLSLITLMLGVITWLNCSFTLKLRTCKNNTSIQKCSFIQFLSFAFGEYHRSLLVN